MNELYLFIKNNGIVARNKIGAFVAGHPEYCGALEKLIKEGKVKEVGKDLFECTKSS